MKKACCLLIFPFLLISIISSAQEQFSPQADSVFNLMMKGINPAHAKWVRSAANVYNTKALKAEDATIMSLGYGILGSMPEGDIEAMAFLVLMQASKSAQEDLKAIMAGVKSINNAKAKQRELLSEMQQLNAKFAGKRGSETIGNPTTTSGASKDPKRNPPGNYQNSIKGIDSLIRADKLKLNWKAASYEFSNTTTKADLDGMVDKAKKDLDSMSEMGEMESLRLQMAMDRMSKMMSTLSNLLKKISDTASQITQNLK